MEEQDENRKENKKNYGKKPLPNRHKMQLHGLMALDTIMVEPLDEGEEESSMEECGLAEAR